MNPYDIFEILDKASNPESQKEIFTKLNEFSNNINFSLTLLDILSNQNNDLIHKYYCIILLKYSILNPIYENILPSIVSQIQNSLTYIFYLKHSLLVSQFSALIFTIYEKFNINIYKNLTDILIDLIQNEDLHENAFIIINELLQTDINSVELIDRSFLEYIHKFVLDQNYSKIVIDLLSNYHDFAPIPFVLENQDKLTIEAQIHFCCFIGQYFNVQDFNNEVHDSINENNVHQMVQFVLKCISNNDNEYLVINAIRIYADYMNKFTNYNNIFVEIIVNKAGVDNTIEYFGISSTSIWAIKKMLELYPTEMTSIIFPKVDEFLKSNNMFYIRSAIRIMIPLVKFCNKEKIAKIFEISCECLNNPTLLIDSTFLIQKLSVHFNQIASFAFEKLLQIYVLLFGNNEITQSVSAYDNESIRQILSKIISKIVKNQTNIEMHPYVDLLLDILTSIDISFKYNLSKYLDTAIILGSILDISRGFSQENNSDIEFINSAYSLAMKNLDRKEIAPSSFHILSNLIIKSNSNEMSSQILSSTWSFIQNEFNQYSLNNIDNGDEGNSYDNSIIFWIFNLFQACLPQNLLSIDMITYIISFLYIALNPNESTNMKTAGWNFLNTLRKWMLIFGPNEKIINEINILIKTIISQYLHNVAISSNSRKEGLVILSMISVVVLNIANQTPNLYIEEANNIICVLLMSFSYYFDPENPYFKNITCSLMFFVCLSNNLSEIISLINEDIMSKLLISQESFKDSPEIMSLFTKGLSKLFGEANRMLS